MIIHLETLSDERLDVYAKLTEMQLRNKLEPEKGIFIAETDKVIIRALEGGMVPHSLLLEARWLHAMAATLANIEKRFPQTPLYVAPHEEIRKLIGYDLTRGALGAFYRPQLPTVDDVVGNAGRIAVLENITNHTNVGAIFRSAAALGIDAILVTPACYDPLYRRAIRVSMGTVFQIPWTRLGNAADAACKLTDWAQEGIPLLHRLGFTTAAMALSGESISLDDPRLAACSKLALVFGTEGDGLAQSTIAQCDYTVRIPMMHEVDSLNVAAASAVAFWELCHRSAP